MSEQPSSSSTEPTEDTVTIRDELSKISFEVKVDDSLYRYIPDYAILLNAVCSKIGLHGDTFQLRNLRINKLYPRCLDHMSELQHSGLKLMDIKGGDQLLIVRMGQCASLSDFCRDAQVTVASKSTQTEPDESRDVIRIQLD